MWPAKLAGECVGDESQYKVLEPLNPQDLLPGGGWRDLWAGDVIYLPDAWVAPAKAHGYTVVGGNPWPYPTFLPTSPTSVGCGAHHSTNPANDDPDRRGVSRAVEVLFVSDGLPAPLVCGASDPDDTAHCQLYDPREFDLEYVEVTSSEAPAVAKFFARPSDHDDETVEAHAVVVPDSAQVILHWATIHADSVAVTAMALDGSTFDVTLPNGGAMVNNGQPQTGQATIPANTARYELTATNANGTTTHYRKVDVATYPAAEGAGTTLDVGDDTLFGAPELLREQKKHGHHRARARPPRLQRRHGAGEREPRSLPCALPKKTLLLLDNFGVDNKPPGRRDAYLDIVAWDDLSRQAMNSTDSTASSCGMFVRMFWFILGFRGGEMDMPYANNTIIKRILDYAGSAARPSYTFKVPDFRPKTGDVLYLWKQEGNHQHIFSIADTTSLPEEGKTGTFTMFSVDGGTTGGRDGSCNGVHRSSKVFDPAQGLTLDIAGRRLPSFAGSTCRCCSPPS